MPSLFLQTLTLRRTYEEINTSTMHNRTGTTGHEGVCVCRAPSVCVCIAEGRDFQVLPRVAGGGARRYVSSIATIT